MKPSLLHPGDIVDIIAPASKFDPNVLKKIELFLHQWGLKARFAEELTGEDFLFANTDEKRFAALEKALINPDSKAIWAVRGGYGCTRLLPALDKITAPSHFKWLMGFSDITALHLYLNQKWRWPSLHCASANQIATQLVSKETIQTTRDLVLDKLNPYQIELTPLNDLALSSNLLRAEVTGGNLCVLMTSLATNWQIQTKDKFLLIEDVNEAPYRVDRMLNQLWQAGLLDIKALLVGEFTQSENDRNEEMQKVLHYWINRLAVPALSIKVGHGTENLPVIFGREAELKLGSQPTLGWDS